MHFKIKSILLCSLLILTVYADEGKSKSDIFNEKYLDNQKLTPYRNVDTSNIDYKISNIKEMTKASEQVTETASKIKSEAFKSELLENEAKKINDHTKSKAFQKEIVNNENYLLYDEKINWQQHLGKYKNNSNKILNNLKEKETVSTDISTNQFLENDEKIFIIISSSIPKHILQNYFEMLQNVNTDVTFVLRGTINGIKEIKPTLNWIQEILTKKDNSKYEYNVIIEPRIVSKYNIEKVPAVLYIKNYDISYVEENKDEKYYVYYGAVDIDYALKKINIDAKSLGIKKLLLSL